MAVNGTVDINANLIGDSVNNGLLLSKNVTSGVAAQGDIIGQALGITIAITLLFGVILLVVTFVRRLVTTVKGLKSA